MTALVTLAGFNGQHTKAEKYFLPDGTGLVSLNQRPPSSGALRGWKQPLAVSPAPNVPSGPPA